MSNMLLFSCQVDAGNRATALDKSELVLAVDLEDEKSISLGNYFIPLFETYNDRHDGRSSRPIS